MEDKVKFLHEVCNSLAKFHDESDDLTDVMCGAILGVALADNIVSGEFDTKGEKAENIALAIIAAITLAESMPVSSLESINKMFSDD